VLRPPPHRCIALAVLDSKRGRRGVRAVDLGSVNWSWLTAFSPLGPRAFGPLEGGHQGVIAANAGVPSALLDRIRTTFLKLDRGASHGRELARFAACGSRGSERLAGSDRAIITPCLRQTTTLAPPNSGQLIRSYKRLERAGLVTTRSLTYG
jgi:hypothetical protein